MNLDSSSLQLIFTGIVAGATLVYAFLTLLLVRETVRLRKVQAEPEIVLYLQPSEYVFGLIDIIVRNVGATPAHNMRWDFNRNHELIQDKDVGLDRMKFFEGIPYFAPGQEFRSFFGSSPDLLSEPTPSPLEVNLTFDNRDGHQLSRSFIIDPMQFYGRSWVGGQPLREAADALKKLQKDFGHAMTGFKRFRVETYGADDRERERVARDERLDALRAQSVDDEGDVEAAEEA